jgi:hypothetical protein
MRFKFLKLKNNIGAKFNFSKISDDIIKEYMKRKICPMTGERCDIYPLIVRKTGNPFKCCMGKSCQYIEIIPINPKEKQLDQDWINEPLRKRNPYHEPGIPHRYDEPGTFRRYEIMKV